MKLRRKTLILIAVLLSTVVLVSNVTFAQVPPPDLRQGIPVDQPGFVGTLFITAMDYNPGRQALTVTGVLNGAEGTPWAGVSQVFEQTATIRSPDEAGVCDILFLDIGPIFLDLLGLTVDLSEIELDIDALRGEGRLLGNLLCALTGLLDPANDGLLGGLTGLVNSLLNSLERLINELLGT